MENTAFNRIRNHIGMVHNGRLLTVFNSEHETDGTSIYLYTANGSIFAVLVDADGNTEIMAPVSRSISIDTTLAKLDEYIRGNQPHKEQQMGNMHRHKRDTIQESAWQVCCDPTTCPSQAAHGDIVRIETCECGYVRWTDINGMHEHTTGWVDYDHGIDWDAR